MGSDMAMERIVTSKYGRWEMDGDEQVFNIYFKSSYDHKENLQVTLSADDMDDPKFKTVLLLTIPSIPPRPEPVRTLRTRVLDMLYEEFGGITSDYGWDSSDYEGITDAIIEEVKKEQ
jgi:hypothetical protein